MKSETSFVIVIEVDNQRAHTAYKKGLEDLELIWPQLMAHATKCDSATNERVEREIEREKRELERQSKEWDDDMAALHLWEARSSIFRGPRPEFRWPRFRVSPQVWDYKDFCKGRYESIRAELKRMVDLSGAAIRPFRMTETQVGQMVGWEDGSRIDRLKAEIVSEQA